MFISHQQRLWEHLNWLTHSELPNLVPKNLVPNKKA